MDTSLNLKPILSFLGGLGTHNNKAWFDQNRPAYEDARETFGQFIDHLIDEFRDSDHLQGLTSKDCIFRINRDVRFSKDKSPYKTNFGALIGPGGRKAMQQGYYISIEPQGRSMVAGGLYMPTPEQLTRFRQAIDRDAAQLKKITRAKPFVDHFGAIEGERLKTAPQGYDRAHPDIELLRLKQVTVLHHFADKEIVAQEFHAQVVTVFRAMKPFLNYLDDILQ
jgi:uncharacterized protein (TIGR02453 family)